MSFDIQKFARDATDTLYRGRRRLSGNWGRLYINNVLIFEISAFECTVTADRDDVIIGQSKDSKITSLTGEGSFTIKQVFTRGFNKLLKNWQDGYDERFVFVATINDPDTVQHQEERIKIENVWVNDLDIMHFSKGEVIDKEISFGFTPEDLTYVKAINISGYEVTHETNGGYTIGNK